MADVNRIYGQKQEDASGASRDGENLARFRRGRQVGDVVRGLFLRLEAARPGTAWISFEGAVLLAILPSELARLAQGLLGNRPAGALEDFPLRPGDVCRFRLETLDPDPVLRMIGPGENLTPGLSLRV